MGSTDSTSRGGIPAVRIPRPRLALVAVALAIPAGACQRDGDAGAEDAPVPGYETESQAAETVAVPPQTDLDGPDPVEGIEAAEPGGGAGAGGPEADTLSESSADDGTAVPERPVQLRVPAGTRVRLTAETDISTDAYEVGDPVIATLAQDVTDGTGKILIPLGTYFLGRVEASAGSGGIGEPAVLEVAFETLSAWNYERPIESVVVDVAVALDPEAERARRSSRSRGAMTVVPGRITAGSIIVVQLREPVFVPSPDPLALPSDSIGTEGVQDTVSRVDAIGAGS